MPRTAKWLLAAAILAAGTGGAVWFTGFRPLSLAVAETATATPVEVFGLGTVEAHVVARLGFKVAGPLVMLAADHGDRVEAGALLARIDAREQQARAAKARSGVANAEAAVQVSQAMASRAELVHAQRQQTNQRRQALLARGTISVEQAEEAQLTETTARADMDVTRSELNAARARLEDAKAQHQFEEVVLAQHELRAPFAGLVIARSKELGAVAAAGEAIFTLVDPSTYWILAYLDEARSGAVALGQHATVRLRSQPGRTYSGRVARLGLEADRVNEERRVYVTCDDCPPGYVLGEQAEVVIRTAELPRALLVPETAIDGLAHGRGTVWVIEAGHLARRAVRLGHRTLDGRHEILEGEGMPPVIVERHAGLSEGRAAVVKVAATKTLAAQPRP